MIKIEDCVVGHYYLVSYQDNPISGFYSQYRGDNQWSDGWFSKKTKEKMDKMKIHSMSSKIKAFEEVPYADKEPTVPYYNQIEKPIRYINRPSKV